MKYETEIQELIKSYLIEAIEDESVDLAQDFALMGLDSMSVFNFTTQLKLIIPSIPLTIFLECKNVPELTSYLWDNHQEELTQFFQSREL